MEKNEVNASLSRSLGSFSAYFLIINSILGMSIFFTPQMIAGALQSPSMIVAAWLIGGIVVLCGALSVAELGSIHPEAGGLYVYLWEAFGGGAGFLFGWAAFIVTFTGSIAALAAAFAVYLEELLQINKEIAIILGFALNTKHLTAILLITALSYLNYRGVKTGGYFQNFLAILKIAALVTFVAAGLLSGRGNTGNFKPFFPETFDASLVGSFLIALIPVYFAYSGWDASTYIGSELKAPHSGIPKSIARGIFSIIFIYLAMNAVYIYAIPPLEMKEVQAIGTRSAEVFFGKSGAILFTILILISIAGCVSAVILTAPRIYYAMANHGLFFRKCSSVHPVYKTPYISIIIQGIWASLLVLTGTIEELLVWVTVVILFMDILLMGALFAIRNRGHAQDSRGVYKTPLFPLTPALFLIATTAILINTFIEKPLESVAGAAILAAGIPLYFIFRAVNKGISAS